MRRGSCSKCFARNAKTQCALCACSKRDKKSLVPATIKICAATPLCLSWPEIFLILVSCCRSLALSLTATQINNTEPKCLCALVCLRLWGSLSHSLSVSLSLSHFRSVSLSVFLSLSHFRSVSLSLSRVNKTDLVSSWPLTEKSSTDEVSSKYPVRPYPGIVALPSINSRGP